MIIQKPIQRQRRGFMPARGSAPGKSHSGSDELCATPSGLFPIRAPFPRLHPPAATLGCKTESRWDSSPRSSAARRFRFIYDSHDARARGIWSAVASAARHRFRGARRAGRPFDFTKAPSPLRSAGALQKGTRNMPRWWTRFFFGGKALLWGACVSSLKVQVEPRMDANEHE